MKPYRELTLADDFMFGLVMRQEKIAKPFLEGLLQCKIDRLVYTDVQHELKQGCISNGISVEVHLPGDRLAVYDIEMHNKIPKNLEKYIRCSQNKIDWYQLRNNEHYGELRKSIIIFIVTTDYYGKGYPIYCKNNYIFAENNKISEYHDGTEVFILNATATNMANVPENTAELLTYMNAVNKHMAIPDTIRNSEYISEIENTISEAKRNETEEASYMHLSVKIEDDKIKARMEGLAEARAEMALNLYREGFSIEKISKLCNLTADEVEIAIKSAEQ